MMIKFNQNIISLILESASAAVGLSEGSYSVQSPINLSKDLFPVV